MFGLGLAFLHKRNAGPAVRRAVAVENGQVHQSVAENVRDDRGEWLSAVDKRKAPIAGKARRREPHNGADSRENFGQWSILFDRFGCFGRTAASEIIFPALAGLNQPFFSPQRALKHPIGWALLFRHLVNDDEQNADHEQECFPRGKLISGR